MYIIQTAIVFQGLLDKLKAYIKNAERPARTLFFGWQDVKIKQTFDKKTRPSDATRESSFIVYLVLSSTSKSGPEILHHFIYKTKKSYQSLTYIKALAFFGIVGKLTRPEYWAKTIID